MSRESAGSKTYRLGKTAGTLRRTRTGPVISCRPCVFGGEVPERWLAAGAERLRRGDLVSAARAFGRAVELSPSDPAGYLNLGVTLRQAGRLDDARLCLERAATLAPDWPEVHYNRARLATAEGDRESAVESCRRAVELAPDWAEAHDALGSALRRAGCFPDAVASHERALELRPGWASALHNRAVALQEMGDDEAAIAGYRQALVDNGELWEIHNNLGFLLLKQGDFETGFRELEWRFQNGGRTPRRLGRPQPVWDGEPFPGQTLLLCEEQGAGDVIQFVRYAAEARERGSRVLVETSASLARLLATVPGVDGVVAPGEPCSEADFQLPLVSLPRVLGARLETIPARVPYVRAAAADLSPLDRFLAPFAGRCKVGIVWTGDPSNKVNGKRSATPGDFAPLARVPGVELFSLQFAPAEAVAAELDGLPIRSLAPYLGDFAATAAVVHRLDLILTIDTSMLHLAGALGRPVWALLHHPTADWRWRAEGETSPWYPTLRLFRQRRPGDWTEVFRRVRQALAAEVGP